jgi:hypothetical protein
LETYLNLDKLAKEELLDLVQGEWMTSSNNSLDSYRNQKATTSSRVLSILLSTIFSPKIAYTSQ